MPSRLDCFGKENERHFLLGVDIFSRDGTDTSEYLRKSSMNLGLFKSKITKPSSTSYDFFLFPGVFYPSYEEEMKSYVASPIERRPSDLCY